MSIDQIFNTDVGGDDPARPGPTLASTVAERLRAAIIAGEIAPGSKVNIDRVRDHLGVSLSPLREALSRLYSEGFLTFQDNRGYRVAPVSDDDLRQIVKLRVHLEPLALRESIQHGDLEWEKLVRLRLEELRASPRDPDPKDSRAVEIWEQAHRNFHSALLSACDMPLLLQFTQTLHDLNDRYRRLFLAAPYPHRDTLAEHIELATAAVERRRNDAIALLKRHIEKTGSQALSALQRS